ncbi:MAG: CcmD family protein [candidate division KSB1 bacterium]|nr:CcmD family protein [candidate division KSB1 bacterium]
MKNLGFLFVAYLLIWLALAAYLLALSTRLKRLERELARLRDQTGQEG